jgi:hypothetical protein
MRRLFPASGLRDLEVTPLPAGRSGERQWGGHGARGLPTCVQVWEPVLRHVALALSALEDTGVTGSSPHLRLATLTRITGVWLTVLNALTGHPPVAALALSRRDLIGEGSRLLQPSRNLAALFQLRRWVPPGGVVYPGEAARGLRIGL